MNNCLSDSFWDSRSLFWLFLNVNFGKKLFASVYPLWKWIFLDKWEILAQIKTYQDEFCLRYEIWRKFWIRTSFYCETRPYRNNAKIALGSLLKTKSGRRILYFLETICRWSTVCTGFQWRIACFHFYGIIQVKFIFIRFKSYSLFFDIQIHQRFSKNNCLLYSYDQNHGVHVNSEMWNTKSENETANFYG